MKKSSFIFLLLCLVSSFTKAQLYLEGYTGYSFSTNPQKIQSTEIINNTENIYVSKFKMGEGINLGFALGYNCSKNFSFEITGNTQIFPTKKISIPQKDISALNNFNVDGIFGTIKYLNKIFQFAPLLIYTIDYNKHLRFFLKAGPDFLIAKTMYQRNYLGYTLDSLGFHSHNTDENSLEKGGINIGIHSAAGIEYKLSKKVYFLCEFLSVYVNYKFKTDETTKYNVDGVDHLTDFTSAVQNNTDGTKTDFSHWGLNIGIKYLFAKR